ncbi:MAG: hypothetical protein QXD78_06170 [Candidatus Bathyarchaeia archaeon]
MKSIISRAEKIFRNNIKGLFLFLFALTIHLGFSLIFILRHSLHKFANIYDAGIFISIAKNGYTFHGSFAMYPLFPLTIKMLTFITNDYDLSSVILAPFFSALSTFIFYKISLIKSKNPLLISFMFTLTLYPWLITSSIPYSEPLYMVLLLTSFYYYIKDNPLKAGIAAALATLTRATGVLLAIPMVYKSIKNKDKKYILASLFPLLTIVFLYTYFYALTGDFFITFKVEREWASDVKDHGTYIIYPFYFLFYFAKYALFTPNYWRIILVFIAYTYALLKLRKDIPIMLYNIPTYMLLISLSPFPIFWFGLDRLLIPIFPVLFAYEEYLSKKVWWSKGLIITLIILSFLQAFRIVERWCMMLKL